MPNKDNLFAGAMRRFRRKAGRVKPSGVQRTDTTPPAEKFNGVYRGQLATLEDPGGAEYKPLDGECAFLLSHDDTGNGTADIYLAGETIGKGLPAKVSSHSLTLSGVLWSSEFVFQGTFCYKNRVMILSGEGVLKDTGFKIQLEVIMVDEWKRPVNNGPVHPA